MVALAVVLDLLILAALYVIVARDEMRREETASEELWARPLSWWTHHRMHEGASRDGLTPSERSIVGIVPRHSERTSANRDEQ